MFVEKYNMTDNDFIGCCWLWETIYSKIRKKHVNRRFLYVVVCIWKETWQDRRYIAFDGVNHKPIDQTSSGPKTITHNRLTIFEFILSTLFEKYQFASIAKTSPFEPPVMVKVDRVWIPKKEKKNLDLICFGTRDKTNSYNIYLCLVWFGYCFTPCQRLRLYNGAPLVAFYDTLGIRRTYSRLKPPASSRGYTFVLNCLYSINWCWIFSNKNKLKAKSRKYRGVFKVKSRVKTRQAPEIWSEQLEHKQVPKRGDGTTTGTVSVPCWHATPVAIKRKRSDSILWQIPLYQQKCQKGKVTTKNATKTFDNSNTHI